MQIVITGARGFIGSALCAALLERGHGLTLLTRGSPRDANTGTKRWLHWTPGALREWDAALDGVDGVINLAGEPIAERRWTEAQRRRIEKSRIDATHSLVQACAKAKQKPHFLINASAVGYYGAHGDETITEASAPGKDFLSALCRDWEEEAKKAEELGLIAAVVPADQLMATAVARATGFANGPRRTFGLIKAGIERALVGDLEQVMELESQLQARAARTPDAQEAIRAFLEKRKPVFEG